MAEVAFRALAPLIEEHRRRGSSIEGLLSGLDIRPDQLGGRGRFAWGTFVEICRRSRETFGSLSDLETATYRNVETPSWTFMWPIVQAVATPRDLLWLGTRWFGRMLFTIIEARFEDLPGGRVRETLVIPEPHSESIEFFHLMRGAVRASPRLLGCTEARVEMHATPRSAVLTIDPPLPRRSTRLLRVRTRAGVERMIEEMSAQQDELRENHDRLQRVNAELEQLVQERTRELVESRAQLERTQRLASLGTLAAGVAHEINNPLAAIQATAQLLEALRDGEDPEGAQQLTRHSLSRIVDESQRCSRIVRGLLQFARDEVTEKWRFDLDTVSERALEAVRPRAAAHGVRLDREASATPVWSHGNPLQLQQALVQVLQNAIEASSAGSAVRVLTAETDGRAHVFVEDAGHGLGPEALARAFEPFFTTRREAGGRGLGLSLAYGIAEEHGGHVRISSVPGEGTLVILDLPGDDSEDAPEPRGSVGSSAAARAGAASPPDTSRSEHETPLDSLADRASVRR